MYTAMLAKLSDLWYSMGSGSQVWTVHAEHKDTHEVVIEGVYRTLELAKYNTRAVLRKAIEDDEYREL